MQNLEKMLFEAVENNTPEEIKKDSIFDYKNEGEFTFKLTQEHVEKLNLWDWFKNYKKERSISPLLQIYPNYSTVRMFVLSWYFISICI